MIVSTESFILIVMTFLLLLVTIRKSKMRIKDSVFWLLWVLTLSALNLFPNLSLFFQRLLDIEDPDIFMFIVVLVFSYFVIFRNTAIISQHEDKIKELTQRMAIWHFEQKNINQNILNEMNKKNEQNEKN